MGEKNLLLRIGLLFFMVYMINSCGGERNEDVAQDQFHETIDSEIFDNHEKEKYFNLKEEVSFANEKDKCKLSTKQVDNLWMLFQNEINAGDFPTLCHCWRLAGGNIEMLESPAECRSLGDYAHGLAARNIETYITYVDGCIWGYEDSCKNGQRFLEPLCKDVKGYRHFRSLKERTDAFWTENDFGYVKNVKKLHMICEPNNQDDSSFECNEELTFCRGRNVLMDFTYNGRSSYERVASKPFEPGQFGGHCRLVSGQFKSKTIYRDKLRSWGVYDIDKFSSLTFKPSDPQNCDVFVDTPTIFADLDFIGNIYHHFCDFFNLYLTLHANNSLYSTFDVAKWSAYEQAGPFGDTWKAFTRNVYPLWSKYGYRKVCFKDVVFGLLPRMAYGLYYSTAVVEGCSRSGMFKAFSEYILDGLSIKRERKAKSDLLRVTLLYRSTRFRKIVNRDELINVMKSIPGIAVQSVDFNRDMPFLEQLAISANSDIFIGIHGAGLAHTLFLPDWAVLFELYNTEDYNCYRDLARLRGVTYVTWEKKEKLKDETLEPDPNYTYEKFRNYRFDVDEFQRLLGIAISHAKENIRVASL